MTFLELIASARRLLDDEGGDLALEPGYTYPWESESATPLWSNADLTFDANEAIEQYTMRRPVLDDTTAEVVEIDLIADTALYAVHASIEYILSVVLASTGKPLTKLMSQAMDRRLHSGWRTDTGTPRAYYEDDYTGALRLYPIPDAEDRLLLTVGRRVIAPIAWEDRANDIIDVPLSDQPYLIYRIAELALQKRDSQTVIPQESQNMGAIFTKRVGPELSAEDRRYRRINANLTQTAGAY